MMVASLAIKDGKTHGLKRQEGRRFPLRTVSIFLPELLFDIALPHLPANRLLWWKISGKVLGHQPCSNLLLL